jgi:hypothetical protein
MGWVDDAAPRSWVLKRGVLIKDFEFRFCHDDYEERQRQEQITRQYERLRIA